MKIFLTLFLISFNALAATPTKIMSYNILASKFIKKEYYPGVDANFLYNNDLRKKLQIEYILNINPDILCIQEYESLIIEESLKDKGYKKFIYTDKDVGIAIFYKNKIKVINNHIINLGNKFALETEIRLNNKNITIINVKIKWTPENLQNTKYEGYYQVEKLIKNRTAINKVICGDFNCTSTGSVYQLFMQNHYKDVFIANPYNTVKANNSANRVDFCFVSPDLYDNITIEKIKGLEDSDVVPSRSILSDHLPLVFTFF